MKFRQPKIYLHCFGIGNNAIPHHFQSTAKSRRRVYRSHTIGVQKIFLNEMEKQLVTPASPIFYIRYVDDTFVRRKKNEEDILFKASNAFHPNSKLTIEENPSKYTLLPNNKDGFYRFNVVNKSSKLSFNFSSQVPLQYKKSVIMGELHRAKAIASVFDFEMNRIKSKFSCSGLSLRFMMYQFNKFAVPEEELLIPPGIFEKRSNVHIKIPFCPKMKA